MNKPVTDWDYDGEMHTGRVYPSGATAIGLIISVIIALIGSCWILQTLIQH